MCERPAWEVDLLAAGVRAELASTAGDDADPGEIGAVPVAALPAPRPDPWSVAPPDL